LELLHERAYIVRSYRKGPDGLVLRGAVRDQKPPGLYVPVDPDPLTMHHMIVDLHIAVPSLEIETVDVKLETHPHAECPRIEENYQALVGLSIARGFINKVRQLFGGPRGCTHTTALLQAMAPVAIQSMWSFRMQAAESAGNPTPFGSPEARAQSIAANLNTCHVWAEDGELLTRIQDGAPMEQPVWMRTRLEKLGIDPETYQRA
ncbi:MAG: hypothetical protein JWM12_4341, partial [Ilumatobacteraceae bacterium]|nr:hypothetical protein [Ilumatobacteraceae bacterium]